MRSRRDTGDAKRARTFEAMGGDGGGGGEGEGEMNVGGSPLMRIHRRRIPFSEDISSLYSPLNQQLPAVLRGRSMLIDIAHPSAPPYPPYIPDYINASTIVYIRTYVSLCPSLSLSMPRSLFLCTCTCRCVSYVTSHSRSPWGICMTTLVSVRACLSVLRTR